MESNPLPNTQKIPPHTAVCSEQEYDAMRVQWYNQSEGKLTGYRCEKCKNRGYFAVLREDGNYFLRECTCIRIRKCLRNIEASGFADALRLQTFDNFQCTEPWQNGVKSIALQNAESTGTPWLYLSGQSGCGKTHLCTAVCGKLLRRGLQVQYTMWRDIVRKLQSYQSRDAFFQQLCTCEVLYIDDFLKTKTPEKELDYAFDVINARYAARARTVISSEITLQELTCLDDAIAGRIRQCCGNGAFVAQIARDARRNYRLHGQQGESAPQH